MPRKNIDEEINKKEELEFPVESGDVIEKIEEIVETKPVSEKIQFTIRRVDAGGFYVVDINGNGTNVAVPKEYKNKNLKAGDIIYVSKSEL
jgi:FKBP-type peptidyl-prolyl cis-trans isomerase 2